MMVLPASPVNEGLPGDGCGAVPTGDRMRRDMVGIPSSVSGPPGGDALKRAARQLAEALHAKMAAAQGGVPTFADNAFFEFIARLEQLDADRSWEESLTNLHESIGELSLALRRIQLLTARLGQDRFVDFSTRLEGASSGLHGASDIDYFTLVSSQGAYDCLQWKGRPLFKTVYDFSIYPMLLWTVRPRTIIELGSGSGASAVWLADLLTVFDAPGEVHSVDLHVPPISDSRVRFVQGDCRLIERVFDEAWLASCAHPILLIEDAHVNVAGVLRYFDRFLASGDYVIVEDSAAKVDDLGRFLSGALGRYKVDTRYTDFFGRNATCAQDSILVRV